MGENSEVYVAFSTAKVKHAVAIAEASRPKVHICVEAGPTGYGLYRQVQALGHDCLVVAPALIPSRTNERVKTNRREALTLARLHGQARLPLAISLPPRLRSLLICCPRLRH